MGPNYRVRKKKEINTEKDEFLNAEQRHELFIDIKLSGYNLHVCLSMHG